MWSNLPRCKPETQAAYYNACNNGKDEFGREVLNRAGVDLTPTAARRLGLAGIRTPGSPCASPGCGDDGRP